MKSIPEAEGRTAFGANVEGYDEARPPYPAWLFDLLVQQNALFPQADTLEIGPGSGLATRTITQRGASPVTLIEPDARFTSLLINLPDYEGRPCQLIHAPFEDADFSQSAFDLVVIATAFHWLAPESRVNKLAAITKAGGFVALLWNVFQDLDLPDPFHEATKSLLADLAHSPSGKPDGLPFALDKAAREAEFTSNQVFELSLFAEAHWTLTLDPQGIRHLYEGFSGISRLPDAERDAILDRLEAVARSEFDGRVERNMTSPLYLFRRV